MNDLTHTFRYPLGHPVALVGSAEQGTVVGRAQHATSVDQYNIRYVAGDGRLIESWWTVDAIRDALVPDTSVAQRETATDAKCAAAIDAPVHLSATEHLEGAALLEALSPSRVINIHFA